MADHLNNAMEVVDQNPGRAVTFTWYATLLFVAIDLIVCIAVAAENDASDTGSSAAAFAAVWVLFLLVAISITGTVILRKVQFHTPLAVGCFLGLTTMMSQLMLVLFGVFIALGNEATGTEQSSDRAFAAFSFLLFVLYLLFSIVLGKYRTTVMVTQGEGMASKDMGGGWNTEQAGPGAGGNFGTPV